MNIEKTFINLKDRPDKLSALRMNLNKFKFDINEVNRLEAVEDIGLPALGCSKSHYLAIANFLCKSNKDYLLVFEDDWRFIVTEEKICEIISRINKKIEKWDVLLLSATDAYYDVSECVDVGGMQAHRLLKSTSTACYLVSRRYAPTLNHVFSKSISKMEQNREIIRKTNELYYAPDGRSNSQIVQDKINVNICTALDHVWAELSFIDYFIALNTPLGYCEVAQSDISGFSTDNSERQFSSRIKSLDYGL